jgi:hypothetical protein
MRSGQSSGFLDRARETFGKIFNRSGGVERRARIFVVGEQMYIHPLSQLNTGRGWTGGDPIAKIPRNAVEDNIGAAVLTAMKASKLNVPPANGAFEKKIAVATGLPDWSAVTQRALCIQVRVRDKISVVQPMRLDNGVFSRVEGKELHGDLNAVKLGHMVIEAMYACE